MSKDTEMQRLEQFVDKMLNKYAELKDEHKQLTKDLAERDSLIAELRGDISEKDLERGEISQRVNKLVDQIEEWELLLDGENDEPLDEAKATEAVAEEEAAPVADEEEPEDKGGQQNLFSISESRG